MVVDPHAEQFFGTDAAGLERVKEALLDVNNRALEGRPADLTVNTHVCRGNFHSTYAFEGGYDPIAHVPVSQTRTLTHSYLEFDTPRARWL